jgi:4'-phosphopantetheinyl transferase
VSDLALPRAGEVHVWDVVLCDVVAAAMAPLSADELERAAGFRADEPRRRFVVVRGALRALLGRYLDAPAQSISFARAPHGKLALAETGGGELRFNVSHSGDRALLAFTCREEPGVDIERVSATRDNTAIAGRFFARPEAEALRAFPQAARPEAFFRCWVRKEACLKALGVGIGYGLDRIDVGIEERPAGFRRIGSLALADLAVAPGYVAAVAVTRDCARIVRRQWPPASGAA